MTETTVRSLEIQRAEFARGPFLAMPIAGTIAWAAIGVCGTFLPVGLAAWYLFPAHRFVVIPAVIVVIYLITIVVLIGRNRELRKRT